MAHEIAVGDDEIDDVMDEAQDALDSGESAWEGRTYEEGVLVALGWVLGERAAAPFEEIEDGEDEEGGKSD